MDLSIDLEATGTVDEKAKIQAAGTLKQTLTVTNHSNETATGVVVETDLQVAMDFWESHQSQTEYGTDWVNSDKAKKNEDKFYGNPETVRHQPKQGCSYSRYKI